jgi:hypothetical protein
MKVYLTQNPFGGYQLRTFDGRKYRTYLFYPNRCKSIYIQSYTNVRAKCELVSQRIVTIKAKGPSGEVIATYELTSGYVDRLCCMLFVDSKVLRFEQGLSFRSSRK